MAPTKRKSDAATVSENHKTTRLTRSSTRLATKATTKKAVAEAVPEPKAKKVKVSSKEKPESKPKAKEAAAAAAASEGGNGSKTIVIEHCKQCNQFKIRAVKVKNDLENAVTGINVLVNPEKTQITWFPFIAAKKGMFEVREEGGKKFVSLLDMKRPFAPMKALDMDAVISDIIDQIK